MEIETISYQQVLNGYSPTNDIYGLAAYTLSEPRRTAFLSNPSLTDLSKPMIILAKENGNVVGRVMNLPSRFKVDECIHETVGGSALEVAEEYRNGDAGIMLMAYNMQHKDYPATLASGFSRVAAKCHKAMGSYMFTFPQLIQIRDYTKILPVIGVPKLVSSIFGWIPSLCYLPFRFIIKRKGNKLRKRFTVEKVARVPSWVNEIALNDGHRFMEVHDSQWFQWVLDNKFHSHERNVNSFYTVSLKGENLGFFMIKERLCTIESRGISNALFGYIVEWGTSNPTILSEYDLNIIALNFFSKDIDMIYLATTDPSVEKKMKRHLLIRMRDAEVAFKDLGKQFKEAKDQNQWRLRLGYADTILG